MITVKKFIGTKFTVQGDTDALQPLNPQEVSVSQLKRFGEIAPGYNEFIHKCIHFKLGSNIYEPNQSL